MGIPASTLVRSTRQFHTRATSFQPQKSVNSTQIGHFQTTSKKKLLVRELYNFLLDRVYGPYSMEVTDLC